MAELTVIWWRDIPAQVTAKEGRARAARELPPRFQEAIDAAAMRAGLIGTDAYLEEWRREPRALRGRPRGGGRCRRPSGSTPPTRTTCSSASCARTERRTRVTETRAVVAVDEGSRDRLRPAVRRDRRADQPDGAQGARGGDGGGQLRHGRRRRDRSGRGGRADARRQRRHPARRRAGDPRPHRRARPVDHRRAALDRLVDRRGARGGARRLPGQGARQLRDRARTSRWSACCRSWRGTAPRSWRSRTTRRGSARTRTCASRSRARSSRARRTTGSRARTSSSTRS